MSNLQTLKLVFVRGWTLPIWLQLLAPPNANDNADVGLHRLRRIELPVYLGDDALALLPGICGATLESIVLHGAEVYNDFRCV